jgi:hypothetical protein
MMRSSHPGVSKQSMQSHEYCTMILGKNLHLISKIRKEKGTAQNDSL